MGCKGTTSRPTEKPPAPEAIPPAMDRNGLSPQSHEGHYWVTHILWALHETGLEIGFKGGTSLSKGFGLIQRSDSTTPASARPWRRPTPRSPPCSGGHGFRWMRRVPRFGHGSQTKSGADERESLCPPIRNGIGGERHRCCRRRVFNDALDKFEGGYDRTAREHLTPSARHHPLRRLLPHCRNSARTVSAWWPLTELNRGHGDFQSPALPTELSGQRAAGSVPAAPPESSRLAALADGWVGSSSLGTLAGGSPETACRSRRRTVRGSR